MASVGPEIAVRLSAQGVQDVVAAFARVRQESKTTSAEVGGLGKAFSGLQGIVASLGVGVAALGLSKLILDARESAENIGKLSEKTGAQVGTLSALALSAHDSEVGMDQLSAGMVKLAKAQVQATQGGKEQIRAFSSLGVSIKDLQTLDPGDLFVKVAQKMAALPPGADRTATALKLFGKAGAELIPMLDALGADGFDQAVAKAKRLGLFLDEDMVNSSRAAQDAFHELEDVAAGLASRFNAGFMPEFTAGVEVLAETIEGQGVDSMRKFGEQAGKAFAYFVSGVEVAKNDITALFETALAQATYLWQRLKQLATNPLGEDTAAAGYQQTMHSITQKRDSLNAYAADKLAQAFAENRQRKPTSYPRGRGAEGDGTSDADRKKALEEAQKQAKAYNDLLQARADNEIAIMRATNSIEEADDKRKYDAGLMTLDEYYDRRSKRIDQAYDEEYGQLQAKEAAALALPGTTPELEDKRQQEVEKIRAQEYELALKRDGDLAAVDDERAKASKDSADKQLANEQRLASMSGDRATASRLALQQEIDQYTELLQKQGASADQIKAAVDGYRDRANAKISFGEDQLSANSAMGDLNIGLQGIQNQAGSGAISQIAATARSIQLEQERLPLLRQIGQQMLANAQAANDPQLVEQAKQFNAQLDQMQAGLTNVKSAATELTDQLTTQGYGAVVDFFADGISGAKSFGDAMGDLANTFEKMVGRMVAQLLTFYLLEAIVGWIAPNSTLATTMKSSSPFSFGKGFAGGGWTGGVAGQPAGVVHGQEFVVKAGAAAENRPMLEAMNSGLTMPRVATAADYATQMPDAGGDTNVNVAAPVINISTPPGTTAKTSQRTGQGGQSITDIVITAVNSEIAKGGTTAKLLQTQYGLTRQGTSRG